MTLKSGDLIRNRYRIMHGLSDTTYRAMDMSLRQSCLVKEFSGTTSERVTQLASLQHPRLPRVIDLVREGDQTLLVMDLVDGVTLAERVLQADEPIPFETIRPWLVQMTETLAYLHQQEPPIAHGDILIDHVVIQPDGSAAFTNFANYSRNPTDDIKGFGMIIGYLVSHTMPPVSADQMQSILTGRTDAVSQVALEMLTGQVSEINDGLHSRFTSSESQKISEANTNDRPDPLTSDLSNPDSMAISTVPLPGRPSAESEPAKEAPADRPVMPWDKDKKGTDTVAWGERAAASEPVDKTQLDPPTVDFEELSTLPLDNDPPATEILDSSSILSEKPAPSGYLNEVDANLEPEKPVSNPQVQSNPVYESRFDGDPDDEQEEAGGFNWLWIIVGIMAGVILLCIACLALAIYFADELPDESSAEAPSDQLVEFDPTKIIQPKKTVAPTLANEVDEFTPGLSGTEIAPTDENDSSNANTKSGVNLPAVDEELGEIIRNDEFGYQFEIPERFTLVEEADGSVTLEAISGNDDKGIFFAVFPLTDETSAERLMAQLIDSAESEGGTIYGDPVSAEFNGKTDLAGSTVTINLPPDEGSTISLLGQMYALESSNSSVFIVATAVPDQFQELTDLLNRFIENLELFA